MEARPCQAIEFFNGTKQMLVPLFQRPYEWGSKEWTVLWDDILEQYEIKENDIVATHFTGAIVTAPAKSIPVGVSKFILIDGQQRLTTIAILICAMRDSFEEDTPRFRKLTKLLVNEDDEGLDYFKLLPTQRDRDPFQALIDRKQAKPSKFGEAYAFFKKRITGTDSDGNDIEIERLMEVVQGRVTVVAIHLGESDDPYLIFESLNAKGAPLEQADLIRNYLLLRLHSIDQTVAHQTAWLPMQDRLPGEALTEFMRQYLMTTGEEVPKSGIYSVLKKRLILVADSQVLSELKRMEHASVLYSQMIGFSSHPHPQIQRQLARLRRWEIATANPFVLKLLIAHSNGGVSDNEVALCLEMIESYAVRRTICAVPTNQLKRVFLTVAKDVPSQGQATWLAEYLSSGTSGRRWPKDEELKDALMRYRAYSPPYDRCKFILEALEASFKHKETVEAANATIEHIMPQTLSAGWTKCLGTEAVAIHEQWLDLIGNLTLTAYNSELSNSPFETKRQLFSNSNFEMNKWIAQREAWGVEELVARTEQIFARTANIWRRPVS